MYGNILQIMIAEFSDALGFILQGRAVLNKLKVYCENIYVVYIQNNYNMKFKIIKL